MKTTKRKTTQNEFIFILFILLVFDATGQRWRRADVAGRYCKGRRIYGAALPGPWIPCPTRLSAHRHRLESTKQDASRLDNFPVLLWIDPESLSIDPQFFLLELELVYSKSERSGSRSLLASLAYFALCEGVLTSKPLRRTLSLHFHAN